MHTMIDLCICVMLGLMLGHEYPCLCVLMHVDIYFPVLTPFVCFLCLDDWDLLESRAEARFRSFAFRATVLDLGRRRRWDAVEV